MAKTAEETKNEFDAMKVASNIKNLDEEIMRIFREKSEKEAGRKLNDEELVEVMVSLHRQGNLSSTTRAYGLTPPPGWWDIVTLGLVHDVKHVFTKGWKTKVVGIVNAASKGAAISYGGVRAWKWLTK